MTWSGHPLTTSNSVMQICFPHKITLCSFTNCIVSSQEKTKVIWHKVPTQYRYVYSGSDMLQCEFAHVRVCSTGQRGGQCPDAHGEGALPTSVESTLMLAWVLFSTINQRDTYPVTWIETILSVDENPLFSQYWGEMVIFDNKRKRQGRFLLRGDVEVTVCLWYLEGIGLFFSH